MAAPFRFLDGKSSERNRSQRHLGCRKVLLVAWSFQHLGLLPKPFEIEELIEVVTSVTSAALSS